ncbi:Uncharacterized [Moorella glycerini]|uniref:Uncharacterized protein n=1 Tax=Neomoorella stamsii TaxID=1266720 RepID=A0A9X7J2F7_9FIRM|nr:MULTISPECIES: hypothetical protein [Moorella]PRR71374.1 hypothetical protein MOST_24250 [Moorella stamsii]CEP66620.1 Uncharacterized [Moorella glycerini]CEP68582.1 Uncharacterized [Moorella glycerini]
MRNNRLENEILQRVDELVQCAISISLKDESARVEQLARGIAMVQEMGDLLLEVLEGREQHLQALLEQLVAQRLPDRRILQSFGNFPRDIQYIISEGTARYFKAREEKGKEHAPSEESKPAAPGETVDAANSASPAAQAVEVAADQPPLEATPSDTSGEPVNEPLPGPVSTGEDNFLPVGRQDDMTSPESETASSAAPAGAASGNQALEALRLALLQAYPDEEVITNYETRGGKIPFFLPRLQLGFEPDGMRYDWRHEFYCRQQGISIRKVAADELANPAYLARRLRREASWRQLT